jgi:signal recognition particle receptor subunit beta
VATDEVSHVKRHTTVAMDHGILHAGDGLELHLYGTPGQRRFDFMWDILSVGAAGIIYLVDGSDADSIDELVYIFDHFNGKLGLPGIVGVTRQDITGAATPQEVAERLNGADIPVLGCDPRRKEDSKILVLSLFDMIAKEQEELEESDFF